MNDKGSSKSGSDFVHWFEKLQDKELDKGRES